MHRKIKLYPGKCANLSCSKVVRVQKLWCSIECQVAWEKTVTMQERYALWQSGNQRLRT